MPRTVLALVCLLTVAAAAENLDPMRIAATAADLIAIPDRSQGSPGAERAVELIEDRLRACGLVPQRVRTTVAVAVDAGSHLEIDGAAGAEPTRIALIPHRSNRAATAGTGGERLSGRLLFAGKGRTEDLVGKTVAGTIVVLDGDSGRAWTQVAQLGAQAVIFRAADRIDRNQVTLQGTSVSLDFPRFVAELDVGLDGATVALTSTVRLEPRTAWTVCARIAGTGNHREAVLLTAGYESPEALPGLCPGATRAWNAALLLETARSLSVAPPVRDVLIAFHGGRSELMRGLRHLTAALALDRSADGFKPDSQLVRLSDQAALQHWRETAMANAFLAAAAEPATTMERLFAQTASTLTSAPVANVDPAIEATLAQRRVEEFIALQAGMRADALLVPLDRKRVRIALRSGMSQSQKDEVARLRPTLKPEIDGDEAVYQRYRTVQQKLAYGKELDADEAPIVRELVLAAQPNLERHLAIVARYRDDWASLVQARQLLAGAELIHLIGLDLSDGNDRFSSATKGTFQTWEDELGWLHSALGKMVEEINQGTDAGKIPFERAAHDSLDEVDAWFGADSYLHEGGIAGLHITAATVSTVNDARLKIGSPADTAAAFAKERFLGQAVGMRAFLAGYIDGAFLANRKSKVVASTSPRIEVEVRSIGSKTGNRGYSYPLVYTLRQAAGLVGDVRYEETWWGDAFGMCHLAFVPERHPALLHLPVAVYGFDAGGRISAVLADSGQQGTNKDVFLNRDKTSDLLPLVFECVPSRLFNIFDPRLLSPLEKVSVLSATREAAPNYFHVESSRDLALSAIFTEANSRLRLTATQGQVGNRLVITGHAAAVRAGVTDTKLIDSLGLPLGTLSTDTALDAAEDAWQLNEERLAKLRKTGINPESLITLHSAAQSHLEQAREAQAAKDWPAARGHAQTAWALSGRVYPSVLSTANDVVYGLVVMLLFSIPFAWVCERLFLAGNTVMRKVIGFALLFVATFLFFYFFHPAFALATTPMIIFLAFVIILMSTWVIGLVYSRFEHEMAQIRMAGMGMHTADVSRLGTLFATVALGISNMRRRPMRTTLTAATVVLMTFILLTFASFNPSVGAQRIAVDAAPPYNGILVRQSGWLDLPEQTISRLADRWAKDFTLHPMRWLAPSAKMPKYPLNGPGGVSDVGGVVGVGFGDPTGIDQALVRGALNSDAPRGFGEEGDWLFLPSEIIVRLGVAPGGAMTLRGVPVRVGSIDQGRLVQITQLGGDPITPLTFDIGDKTRQDDSVRLAQLAGDQTPAESTTAVHLSPTAVGIAHLDLVERLGGGLRSVALVPRDRATDVGDSAEEIARELACTLRVGESGESYLLTSVGRLSVAGLGAVLIPLILGGMIIFSTMLNSVAERGKEIFIYASLGLAPIHVAALFLVEASIYAVLGGLGGYMLAQVIISILGLAASFGWGVQPDLNYSSFTAVITILLVMATVLLSALYPALVASQAANPGTTDFKLPDPQGDRLVIPFPFTVAGRDVRGLCAFLTKYFESHNESAAGCFTAADAGMHAEGDGFAVDAKVWLSPFDLGISQRFTMHAVPTDVRAIYSVQLTLDLLSGQRAAWKRTNLAFLKDLRQQFLVWRTLSPETMDFYRAEGGDGLARKRLAARAALASTPTLEGAT